MDGFEILVPLAPFIMVVLIVAIPAWLKSKERQDVQATIRSAIEKGQALPPEMIEAMGRQEIKQPATAGKDLRTGVVLVSVSLGITILAYAMRMIETEVFYPIAGAAAIPGAIGAAFIILSFFNKNKG